MHALAATGTGIRRSPRFIQVRDHLGVDAPAHDVPGVGAFDLVANPHATGAEDAAVVIDDETVVRRVHFFLGITIRKMNVRDAQALAEHLHLAVPVRDAHRADVIALGKKQFENHPPVILQALGIGGDFHAFFYPGNAGRKQLVLSLDFNQAHAAGANIGQAIHLAKPRDEDAILSRHVENGFFLAPAQVAAIDL